MGLFRKAKNDRSAGGDLVVSEEERVQQQLQKLESFLENEPERIRQQMEDERTTMPPPDDIVDRRREKIFYTQLSRGEMRNERRSQAGGALLFVLLASAIAALSSWIYSVLQGI